MSPLDQPEEAQTGSMPFLDHLEELRKRLIRSTLVVVVFAIVAFYFSDQLMQIFVAPLGSVKLHVTEVTGSFSAYLKVSLITGILGALPYVFFQLWGFISPGLYQKERRVATMLVISSTVLFLCGALFCYFFVLPWSLEFLIGFSGDLLSPIITVGSYLSFAGVLIIAFGIGFELPVVAYFLGRLGMVSSAGLGKGRRYAVVIILIAAAILTPTPDVFTQLMLAVPLYILYEISIIVVRLTGRRG